MTSSGAGRKTPGAGYRLPASPKSKSTSSPDAAFLGKLRPRLRFGVVSLHTLCACRIQQSNRACRVPVQGPIDHAHDCCHAKVRFRHNSMRDRCWSYYRQARFHVATEQSCFNSGQAQRPRQTSVLKRAQQRRCLMRMCSCLIRTIAMVGPLLAITAAREETNKMDHYRPRSGGRALLVVPLAFET